MTVAELIAALQQCPDQTARVIIWGYEGGFHDVGKLEVQAINLDVNTEWYYGPHDSPGMDKPHDEIAILLEPEAK